MSLVTDQQETMFSEPEEAVVSYEAELIHHEEFVETQEAESAALGSLDFPAEAAVAVPVAAASAVPASMAEVATEPAATQSAPAEGASAAVEAAPAETASAEAGPVASDAVVPENDTSASAEAPAASALPESAPDEPLPILTAADFTALEERVLRAVNMVRREREARTAAEERVLVLEGRVSALQLESAEGERLKEEIEALRAEREQVRLRVERLLGQLDALDF